MSPLATLAGRDAGACVPCGTRSTGGLIESSPPAWKWATALGLAVLAVAVANRYGARFAKGSA